MKNKSFVIIPLISCAVVFLCISIPADAVTLDKTAKLVPPETVLLFDIEDFGRLETQLKKTNLYKLYEEPSMAKFIEHVKSKWKEENPELEKDFTGIFSDIDTPPQGRVALAITFSEQTADINQPPILLITQWGPAIEKIKTAMDKLVESEIENGLHKRSSEYRGVTITSLLTEESSEDLNFCIIDDCLIASFDSELLKFTIAHIQGASSTTLADDNDYNNTVRAIDSRGAGSEGHADLYINIKQIFRIASAKDTSGKVKTAVNNLGLDNVTSLCCSLGPASLDGGNSSAKTILKIDGPKKGICKMLDLQSEPLRTPKFISDSTSSISFINIDIKKAFEELTTIMNSFSPQYGAIMYMPLLPPGPQGEPGVQLKADVIDYFGSQIIISQNVDKSTSSSNAPDRRNLNSTPKVQSLIAVAITNRNALERSLSTLHSTLIAPNNPESQRQLLGYTLYLLDPASFIPGLAGPMAPMRQGQTAATALGGPVSQNPKMAFTFTDTHLLISEESIVERAIRTLSGSQTTSIDSADWFRKAKSYIPSAVGIAGLENNAAMGEYFWTILRQMGRASEHMAGNTPPGGEHYSFYTSRDQTPDRYTLGRSGSNPGRKFPEISDDMFDFSLLPEFDTVRKYFGLSAFYGISIPEGFFFEVKYLKPESTQ